MNWGRQWCFATFWNIWKHCCYVYGAGESRGRNLLQWTCGRVSFDSKDVCRGIKQPSQLWHDYSVSGVSEFGTWTSEACQSPRHSAAMPGLALCRSTRCKAKPPATSEQGRSHEAGQTLQSFAEAGKDLLGSPLLHVRLVQLFSENHSQGYSTNRANGKTFKPHWTWLFSYGLSLECVMWRLRKIPPWIKLLLWLYWIDIWISTKSQKSKHTLILVPLNWSRNV